MNLSEFNNNKYIFIFIKYELKLKLSYWKFLEITGNFESKTKYSPCKYSLVLPALNSLYIISFIYSYIKILKYIYI